ncbi:hypothetical protein O6H91_10G086300 [Diphasiastrum complanatum]|uniref:Uncharacterized protein n=1 Tax=Diphasiastrum complanatum TaxID=34168 RepID=A0ACC2CJ17_DIPCM|nr:hypothetical protein O6H91_10G086300 [Diphasiastrum complanatum]
MQEEKLSPEFSSPRFIPNSLGLMDSEEDQQAEQRIEPHEMWLWFADNHWKQWHGVWVKWQPLESSQAVLSFKSMRSFREADGSHRTHCIHRNDWCSGAAGDTQNIKLAGGPWDLYEEVHSLPNGIVHPQNTDSRLLQFPNGDLGWLQLALTPGHPRRIVFGEVQFLLPSKAAKVAVIMGFDGEDKLGVSQILEESKVSDEKPDPSWEGTLWKHHCSPLEKTRAEPRGTFVGTEMILTPGLMLTRKKALWRGFKGGMDEESAQNYTLMHLPYDVTCWAPKKAAIGKEHAFVVHWIVNQEEIRTILWNYGENGCLQFLKTALYCKRKEDASELPL